MPEREARLPPSNPVNASYPKHQPFPVPSIVYSIQELPSGLFPIQLFREERSLIQAIQLNQMHNRSDDLVT
jgi:hypothetical protein